MEDREKRLASLREEHRKLDERIGEMERTRWLTPEEDAEVRRLKKMKLKLKDEIRTLTEMER